MASSEGGNGVDASKNGTMETSRTQISLSKTITTTTTLNDVANMARGDKAVLGAAGGKKVSPTRTTHSPVKGVPGMEADGFTQYRTEPMHNRIPGSSAVAENLAATTQSSGPGSIQVTDISIEEGSSADGKNEMLRPRRRSALQIISKKFDGLMRKALSGMDRRDAKGTKKSMDITDPASSFSLLTEDMSERIVLKFTTVTDGSSQPSFTVTEEGATVGQGAENTLKILSDECIVQNSHAIIHYQSDAPPGSLGFLLEDGGHGNDYSTAIRLSNNVWPIKDKSRFSAGNSVFECTRTSDGVEKFDFDQTGGSENGSNSKDNKNETSNCIQNLQILAITGPLKGQYRTVTPEGASLGRATDNSISVPDKELSRRHSHITYDRTSDEYHLRDVGSLNGTYTQLVGPNGHKHRLSLGDHFLVGRTGLSVNRFDYGMCERMGARPSMEDKSIMIQNMCIPGLSSIYVWPQTYAGVYDGHGGAQASEYLWEHLHTKLADCLQENPNGLLNVTSGLERLEKAGVGADTEASIISSFESLDKIVKQTVSQAFKLTDDSFIANSGHPQAGSTATTVLILGRRIYVANVGDSRTLLARKGGTYIATKDHKPQREDEEERIRNAGGFIVHKRVMGNLAVSRAFGDAEFKKGVKTTGKGTDTVCGPLVISEPEFMISQLSQEDEFLVLACDGLFDVYSNEEVMDAVRREMDSHGDVQRCCEAITLSAIRERHTRDNVTMIVIMLQPWPAPIGIASTSAPGSNIDPITETPIIQEQTIVTSTTIDQTPVVMAAQKKVLTAVTITADPMITVPPMDVSTAQVLPPPIPPQEQQLASLDLLKMLPPLPHISEKGRDVTTPRLPLTPTGSSRKVFKGKSPTPANVPEEHEGEESSSTAEEESSENGLAPMDVGDG